MAVRFCQTFLTLWATSIMIYFGHIELLPFPRGGAPMLTLLLPRRNIRFHLALPHRIPDRAAPLPPRDRLSDARIPSLAGQSGP